MPPKEACLLLTTFGIVPFGTCIWYTCSHRFRSKITLHVHREHCIWTYYSSLPIYWTFQVLIENMKHACHAKKRLLFLQNLISPIWGLGCSSVIEYSRNLIWPRSIFFILSVWCWFSYGMLINSNNVWIWGIIQICKTFARIWQISFLL